MSDKELEAIGKLIVGERCTAIGHSIEDTDELCINFETKALRLNTKKDTFKVTSAMIIVPDVVS